MKGIFMKDKFLIGELSKIFNISTDTLRHYDKIDLIKPEYNENNDYRYYSIRDFFKLSRILFLKNLDISLSEIKKYMSNKNTNNLVCLLKKKEEEIDIKMNKLLNLKNKIQTKLELLENIEGELDQIIIKKIPQRIGAFIDINNLESDYILDSIQYYLTELLKSNSQNHVLQNIIFRDIEKIQDSKKMINSYIKEQSVYEDLAFYFAKR